ncbi:MAG: single-stranded-DNA-specific exonuclease RecJ [Spirochaetia bacterium]
MIWNKKQIDKDEVRTIAGKYNLDLMSASIFVRRGVTDGEEIQFFLENDIQYTHNPFLFDEIEDAIDRIQQAKIEGEKILIFGDRDVDGITSTVLLTQGLRDMGLEVRWQVPIGDEPYGLSSAAVQDFAANDGTLIITVDCGISNSAEIEEALELGIDTIVIDHHEASQTMPPALAILNPKLPDSSYPFRHLSGCGVVVKLLWALKFASSPIYNHPICLLNVRPTNDAYVLDAVKILNLVEIDRISETLVPGVVNIENTRIIKFFEGQEIYTYDANLQMKMLKKVFGNTLEIHLQDLSEEIWKEFPVLRGKSLLKIREMSKRSRYFTEVRAEVDVLKSMFLKYSLTKFGWAGSQAQSVLDLAALSTLADLMPLQDENRVLVRKGMLELASTKRLGLKCLLSRLNLSEKALSTTNVSWQIAPVINASGRMGEPNKAVELLLSDNPSHANRLAQDIIAMNDSRKEMGEEVWNRVFPEAQKSFAEHNRTCVLVGDTQIHRGITGIIASRLMKHFKVPAVVVSIMDENAIGSMRSIKGVRTRDVLQHCSDLFLDFGGHDFAAGFTMETERYQEFVPRFYQALIEVDVPQTEEAAEIDAEVPPSYLKPDLWEVVDMFEPFGENNPQLTFMTKNITVAGVDLVGKTRNHVKMILDSGKHKWPALYWNSADKIHGKVEVGAKIDLLFHLEKNFFQGNERLQLNVLDLKPAGS